MNVKGLESAHWGIERLNLQLDKLGTKDVTAHVNVDVDRSLLSRVGGLFGGGGGGAAGAAGAAGAGAPAGGGGLAGLAGAAGPVGITAGIVAALAALPFAAQAAATGITTVLGGAFTAIDVYGAMHINKVKTAFASLKKSASEDLRDMARPFGPADGVRATGGLLGAPAAAAVLVPGPLRWVAYVARVWCARPGPGQSLRPHRGNRRGDRVAAVRCHRCRRVDRDDPRRGSRRPRYLRRTWPQRRHEGIQRARRRRQQTAEEHCEIVSQRDRRSCGPTDRNPRTSEPIGDASMSSPGRSGRSSTR